MNSKLRYFLNAEAKEKNLELRVPKNADAGFDLPCLKAVVIPANSFVLLETGVHLAIPEGWVGLIRDRSSVALRGGAVTAGVIDSSYRGEVKIAFHNLGNEPIVFEQGERIAQCVIVPHLLGTNSEMVSSLDALGDTARGSGGFGSTGK